MNRGSVGSTFCIGPVRSGFNEAPIHESGKCEKAGSGQTPPQSFNEAPIHESGKCSASETCRPSSRRLQ